MQIKTYNYNSTISLDELISYLNKFSKEIKSNNVKYIELKIKLSHSNGSEFLVPTGLNSHSINIKSKMKSFTMILKKNTILIEKYYNKNEIFSQIQFHYKEIIYADFIKANDKKLLFLKTFTEKI